MKTEKIQEVFFGNPKLALLILTLITMLIFFIFQQEAVNRFLLEILIAF